MYTVIIIVVFLYFRYINYLTLKESGKLAKADGSRVIAMSLYGKDPKYTYGAIRNAQLTPVIYPGWKLRIYITNKTESQLIPSRILQKLKSLGAELAVVSGQLSLAPKYWRYLVMDDVNVKEFLIRDVHDRLTDRERVAVEKWLASKTTFHFIKDHPKHSKVSVPEGLWAANRQSLITALGNSIRKVLSKGGDVLQSVIWPAVKGSLLCHDSVTCTTNTLCKPFPVAKRNKTTHGLEYIGQIFNQYMDPADGDASELAAVKDADKCMVDG